MGVKMKAKKVILCGILTAVLCLLGSPLLKVAATEGSVIEVETPIVDFGYAEELGTSYTKTFALKNTSEEKVVVKLTTEDYTKDIVAESKVAKDWLSFVGGKNVYEIDAQASADVAIRFNVPTEAEKGRTQYVIIKATVTSEAGKDQSVETLAKITVTDENLEFGGASDNELTAFSLVNEIKGAAIIKNSGKVGFVTTVTVRVSPAFGLENWEEVINEESVEVAPSQNGERIEFSKEMSFGIYKVEQKISYVNSEGKIITATNVGRVILCPVWLLAVLGGVILLVVVVIVVIKLKKRNKKEEE